MLVQVQIVQCIGILFWVSRLAKSSSCCYHFGSGCCSLASFVVDDEVSIRPKRHPEKSETSRFSLQEIINSRPLTKRGLACAQLKNFPAQPVLLVR